MSKPIYSAFIILQDLFEEELFMGIHDLDEIAICHPSNELMYFLNLEDAKKFKKRHKISGNIVKISLHRSYAKFLGKF